MDENRLFKVVGWAAILGAVVSILLTIAGNVWLILTLNRVTDAIVFGDITDALSVLISALMIPVALGLHRLLRPQAPVLSLWAAIIGIVGMLAYGTLQALLVAQVLTYEQESLPSFVATGGVGIWLLLANYAALRGKVFPRGLAWAGLIAGVGFLVLVLGFLIYPIWAIWLGRWLLRLGSTQPVLDPGQHTESRT